MSRATYVIRDGKCVEKHLAEPLNYPASDGATSFIPDIVPFVSPIDGTVINSRTQYRDHCKRHDVVPTAELAGLSAKPTYDAQSRAEVEARKQVIADKVYRR